jgi:hypothetical protein
MLVHADARIKDAQAILENFINREMEIDPENETDKVLIDFYKGKVSNNTLIFNDVF